MTAATNRSRCKSCHFVNYEIRIPDRVCSSLYERQGIYALLLFIVAFQYVRSLSSCFLALSQDIWQIGTSQASLPLRNSGSVDLVTPCHPLVLNWSLASVKFCLHCCSPCHHCNQTLLWTAGLSLILACMLTDCTLLICQVWLSGWILHTCWGQTFLLHDSTHGDIPGMIEIKRPRPYSSEYSDSVWSSAAFAIRCQTRTSWAASPNNEDTDWCHTLWLNRFPP